MVVLWLQMVRLQTMEVLASIRLLHLDMSGERFKNRQAVDLSISDQTVVMKTVNLGS